MNGLDLNFVVIRSLTITLYTTVTMDFSQFTGTEQAHMTKVIEKKQVGLVLGISWSIGAWKAVGGESRMESPVDEM